LFGIEKRDAVRVMTCWGVFNGGPIKLDNRCVIHPEEAFLIYLCRCHNYIKLTALEREFGIDYTILSNRCFNQISEAMVARHFHRLFDNLNFWAPRFPMYNEKINSKYRNMYPGENLPLHLRHVAGFEDGTRVHVSCYYYYYYYCCFVTVINIIYNIL